MKKAQAMLGTVVIVLIVVLFLAWVINESWKECRNDSDCEDAEFCDIQVGEEGGFCEPVSGECGYPSSEHTTSWKGRGPWGENIQAKWLLRRFLCDLALDIPVTVYFLLREPQEENRVNAKGLLRYGTWQPKPAYRALQHLTSVFDQRLMTSRESEAVWEFEDEGSFNGIRGENLDREKTPFSGAKAPYPIQVIGLTGGGGNAVVYYVPWRMQEYVRPAKVNVRIKDISIKDPVLVDLLTGIAYRVQTLDGGRDLVMGGIPLTDYPMAAVPRSMVPMNKCSTTGHEPTPGEESAP